MKKDLAGKIEDARGVLRSARPALMGKGQVVATGVGFKHTNGKMTDQVSIVCSVESKKPLAALRAADLVPPALDGIATDVYVSGPIRALQAPTERFRPAPGGVSIGHFRITAGTLGCAVVRQGRLCLLSNNHVLANSNDAQVGDDIVQPGTADGGARPADIIARLTDFVPIAFDSGEGDSDCPTAVIVTDWLNALAVAAQRRTRFKAVLSAQPSENLVDAAVAEPRDDADLATEILQIGRIAGLAEAALGMPVKKSGRTTGLTNGAILQVDVTAAVDYGAGRTATFVDQVMAGSMSAGGDSGSAVLNNRNELVGLLFAGSASTTIINRIQHVFSLLQLSLPRSATSAG